MASKSPLVMVEWVDSAQPRPDWQFLSDLHPPNIVNCASVGWLVVDNKKIKALAPNMGSTDNPDSLQASGIITIPTQAVTKITRIKEPRRGNV